MESENSSTDQVEGPSFALNVQKNEEESNQSNVNENLHVISSNTNEEDASEECPENYLSTSNSCKIVDKEEYADLIQNQIVYNQVNKCE